MVSCKVLVRRCSNGAIASYLILSYGVCMVTCKVSGWRWTDAIWGVRFLISYVAYDHGCVYVCNSIIILQARMRHLFEQRLLIKGSIAVLVIFTVKRWHRSKRVPSPHIWG